jgi:histidinol-phosphatase (PHP family)
MLDYHVHSTFSPDGEMTMEEACRQAVSLELKEVAVTDHMDIDLPDNEKAFQIKDMNQYISELERIREDFKGRLKVKKGIEIGLQDWTLEMAADLTVKYPFDFVIASVHLVNGEDPYFRTYFHTRDKIKSYTDYYHTILDLLKDYDNFNVLGHLDYFRRYSPYEYKPQDYRIGLDLTEAILRLLVQKGKGIELNTAGFRHSSNQPHPHPEVLKWFRELGGEIVTIGSDAHNAAFIGYEYKRAVECLKYAGFDYVAAFSEMKPEFIRI